jgi:hypothetical protein
MSVSYVSGANWIVAIHGDDQELAAKITTALGGDAKAGQYSDC